MAKIIQTAGRQALGDFAPEFAHYNDDILFGENWNNEDIDMKTRCIITVVAIMASGTIDSSLKFHLMNAKQALQRKRLRRSLHMSHFMPDGLRAGRYSIWRRKYGLRRRSK